MNAVTKVSGDSRQTSIPCELMHDLRTPLNQILGYSELLIEQMREQGHEEFIPHLEKIGKAGHELLAMITENFTLAGPSDSCLSGEDT